MGQPARLGIGPVDKIVGAGLATREIRRTRRPAVD
jgi:hypothetical protein